VQETREEMAIKFNSNLFVFDNKNTKFSQPPGTLSYEGDYKDVEFHGQVIIYSPTSYRHMEYESIEALISYLDEVDVTKNEIVWLNVIGLNNVSAIETIGNRFEISKLHLEDVVHVSRHNKMEIHDKNLFSINQMIYLKDHGISRENLSIYFHGNTIITFQEMDGDVFELIRERIKKDTGLVRKQSSEYLCYSFFDALVDSYLLVLNKLAYSIDLIEEGIIDSKDANMNEVYNIKKQLLLLKTAMYPLLNVNDLLENEESGFMSEVMIPYISDLKDHIDQLTNEINLEREIINNLFETHMLNVSNDMNKIMTTLTIYSAVFIPLSFLASVFGMNFKYMPGLAEPKSFYLFFLLCGVIAVSLISFFKIKKWF